ncbi:two-component system activity regulator YycH [Leuconostoc fallax]|uniref:two-component system activity regulator YycH n=1 Tax=Leuconostoc fallax TaxID=1251 RepID=UPI0020915B41|nr:two-component system activity regulator YycH [Leuconostoc fallax]MCO6184166.1 YycH family regulatory protein [Leuconostoc fallax]
MHNQNARLQAWVLGVTLSVLLLGSFALTGMIFMNSEKKENTTPDAPITQTLDIFRPTQYIYSDEHAKQYLIQHPQTRQLRSIYHLLNKLEFSDVGTKKASNQEMLTLLKQSNTQIFRYSDVIPMQYFNSYYNQDISAKKNFSFDYFVLSLGSSGSGYFINTRTHSITTVKVSHVNAVQTREQLVKSTEKTRVTFGNINQKISVFYQDKIHLPTYSYLINRRDPSIYVSALLGTLNQIDITTKNQQRTYVNKITGQSLVYDGNANTVRYRDSDKTRNTVTKYNERMAIAFAQLNLLKINFSDTRFYENFDDGKKLTFRTIVEGIPVYYQSPSGAITISFDNKGRVTSTYSLNELGIPVPNDGADVTLADTATVLKELEDAKISATDYQSITPGYQWVSNNNSNAAVDMKPTWMIETHNQWMSLEQFLKEHAKS